ncbi:MAG TPA: 8-oxo-dGTP diphosphatase, partial [Candidatus Magasanikbacteria bacterium]|nr:8-oxo-dGTP diphosphatase [Candidatus Magasanikbacteria bacterium]
MIDAVLVYPIRDGKVLMIQGAQPYAPHYRKWNGPGGKLKDGQTFLECALAELFEETGLTALETEDVGLLTVFVDGCLTRRVRMYRVTQFSGIPTSNGREG